MFNFLRNYKQTKHHFQEGKDEIFCPRCNASLSYQSGFDKEAYAWVCKGCGMMLINPEAENDEDIVWICDRCNGVLNTQKDFSGDAGEWACTECGFVNVIDEANLYASEVEFQVDSKNPLRGLPDEDLLEMSLYEDVTEIKGHSNVILCTKDSVSYVKKIYEKATVDVEIFEFLKEHPIAHMPRIEALFESTNHVIIIEEFIEGTDLSDCVLDAGEALGVAIDLCRIVMELHRVTPPIIHRDIKASNIIISKRGDVCLMDMDAAKWFEPGQKEDTVMLGTREYAAPEQFGFTAGASSVKTDIYAQGVLFNKMITGKAPKEEKAPGAFGTIVDRCTRLEPDERFTDEEYLAALEALEDKYD